MTNAEYDAFMARLNRLTDADAQGTTRLGQRYLAKPDPEQREHASDHEFHKYNDDNTGA